MDMLHMKYLHSSESNNSYYTTRYFTMFIQGSILLDIVAPVDLWWH